VGQDIHYVDASKYADTPVFTLKNLFAYWFEKVAWHKPSVIILDNLDKLLSAEVEVCSFAFSTFATTLIVQSTQTLSARGNSRKCSSQYTPLLPELQP
jgi:peroxin-1